VQSGTAALYGAIKALGVSQASHYVLCPSFTCAAAADAVVHAGGTPIAIDCELDTYGVSAEAVRRALGECPSVVGVVIAHCYGVPIRDFHEVYDICKEKGIWLCEDACETYGAYIRPREKATSAVPIGSLGTLNVISTRAEKMIGVGEGGAIVGDDSSLVALAKWWCSRAPCRGAGLWRVYEHEGVGQNYRLPEMLGCVGCAAAEMLPTMIERKRRIHDWYLSYLRGPGLDQVKMQSFAEGDEPVWWVNTALMPEGVSGEEVGMQVINDNPEIEIRPGFFPLDQMAIFQNKYSQPCPISDLLYRRIICLPSSINITEEDVERIAAALQDALRTVTQRSVASNTSSKEASQTETES
jgi:pyridoxal phosphate-dependent aminotransferase EpsN